MTGSAISAGGSRPCEDPSRHAAPGTRSPPARRDCYEITGTHATPIKALANLSFRPNVLRVSRVDPSRVWIGLFDGLASFRWQDGRWIDEGKVEGVTEQMRSLFENADGSLWVGTNNDGAMRVNFASPPVTGAPRPAATLRAVRRRTRVFRPAERSSKSSPARLYFAVGEEKPYIVVRFDEASGTFSP